MRRDAVVELCDKQVLDRAVSLFGATKDALSLYESYEGCQNLVYDYEREGQPLILRISYRPDRPVDQIKAELHFVNYLADHGVGVARALPSQDGNLVESVLAAGISFLVVCFVKGKGLRVPDNEYRYRAGIPIEEYFQSWGRLLGQMHALAKDYMPISESVKRPEWFQLHRFKDIIDDRVLERLPLVRDRFEGLLAQIQALPKDRDSFGLIHGDFNDGNFTVDYDNGDITVFDFDDACYFWFMYELACAWEGGVGRAMFSELAERKAFMSHYFDQVLEGYHRANTLSTKWLERLPLFLKLIEMEEFLHYVQYIDQADEAMQGGLNYKIYCIENDIPYLGFYDGIYSPSKPFSL